MPHFTYGTEKGMPLQNSPDYQRVDVVPLETDPRSLIRMIENIEVYDTLIVIKDNLSVFIFNDKGKFISEVGRQGEGPDEYGMVNTFFIDKATKRIVLIDEMKQKYFSYDYAGRFLFSEDAPGEAIKKTIQAIPVEDGLLLNHYINFEANNAFTYLKDSAVESTLSYEPVSTEGYLYALSKNVMTSTGGGIDFILPYNDTIYTFKEGKFLPKYTVDLSLPMVPREHFHKTDVNNSHFSMILKYAKDGYFTGFKAIYETQAKILLSYFQDGLVMAYYLGDKKSMTGNYYLYTTGKTVETIPFLNIQGSTENAFIGVYDAQSLLLLKDKIGNTDNNPALSSFKNIVESLDYEDNPVLFFYYF